MKKALPIKTLFVDIGGVLLTNGWDHISRKLAAEKFHLDWAKMEQLHELTFENYEVGKIPLKEYLARVVFTQKRPFTEIQFRNFMFEQSQPFPEMLDLVARVKARHGLKVVVVSNEGRELNAYRVRTFKLDRIVDYFISSSFVRMRKPDMDIFRLALDVAYTPPQQTAYLENTVMFVHLAETLGIRGILHTDYKSTRAKLESLGLPDH